MGTPVPHFTVQVTSFQAAAHRGSTMGGNLESSASFILRGQSADDSSGAVTVFASFSDNPRPSIGLIPNNSTVVLYLRLADLPAWSAAAAELPADLTVWRGEGDSVREVMLTQSGISGDVREMVRQANFGQAPAGVA